MAEQRDRLFRVLDNIKVYADEFPDDMEALSEMLEIGLNDLQSRDVFGTEGQCDPRGDQREGTWTMWNVAGVDDDTEEFEPKRGDDEDEY